MDYVNSGHVTAYGPGLIHGMVNKPAVFSVNTKDAGEGIDDHILTNSAFILFRILFILFIYWRFFLTSIVLFIFFIYIFPPLIILFNSCYLSCLIIYYTNA